MRERAHAFERFAHAVGDVVEQREGGGQVGVDQLARQLQVDGERYEMLLDAVVEVALDPAALGIGFADDLRTRRSQLVDLTADPVGRCGCIHPRPFVLDGGIEVKGASLPVRSGCQPTRKRPAGTLGGRTDPS